MNVFYLLHLYFDSVHTLCENNMLLPTHFFNLIFIWICIMCHKYSLKAKMYTVSLISIICFVSIYFTVDTIVIVWYVDSKWPMCRSMNYFCSNFAKWFVHLQFDFRSNYSCSYISWADWIRFFFLVQVNWTQKINELVFCLLLHVNKCQKKHNT